MKRSLLLFCLIFAHSLLFAQNINVDLSYDVSVGCGPLTVSFQDQSTSSSGIVYRQWNFGDGDSSSLQNPIHTYTKRGQFIVTLTVRDSAGYTASNSYIWPKKYVVVLPVLNIGDDYLLCTMYDPNNKVILRNKPAYPYEAALGKYSWSTGDTTASINVNTSGAYKVSYNVCGQTLQDSANVYVTSDTTRVWIAGATNWNYGSSALDMGIAIPFPRTMLSKMSVNWGDGQRLDLTSKDYAFLNANSFRHWYKKPGTYRITFVTSPKEPNGYCDTLQEILGTVREPYVNPELGNDTTIAEGDTLVLDAGSPGAQYWWSTGETTQTIKVATAGFYSVYLTKNGDATNDSIRIAVKPRDSMLIPRIGIDSIRCNQVYFRDSSSAPHPVIKWEWKFGDGATDTLQNPIHHYSENGIYTIKLKVTNNNGYSDSTTRSLSLFNKPAIELGPDTSIMPGDTLVLDAGNPVFSYWASYVWSTGQTGTRCLVTTPGTYWVRATYCGAVVSDTIRISADQRHDSLQAYFTYDNAIISCQVADVPFHNRSFTQDTIVSVQWDFGDSTTTTIFEPTHTYRHSGTYIVSLVVRNSYGDVSSFSDSVHVSIPPFAKPVISRLHNTLLVNDGGYVQHQWYLNDTLITNATNNSYLPTLAGAYTVLVHNAYYCQDTSDAFYWEADTTLVDSLQAYFTYDNAMISCQVAYVPFHNRSFTKDTIVSVQWDFGDGNTTTIVDPTYTYTHSGTYIVTLEVRNSYGDVSSFSDSVQVSIPPFPKPVISRLHNTLLVNDGGYIQYEWYRNDSLIINATTNSYQPTTAGAYTVMVRNAYYCQDTSDAFYWVASDTTLVDSLQAYFTHDSITAFCSTADIYFYDKSVTNDSIVSWQWDFGDGHTFAGKDPIHSYSSAGSFRVTLEVRNTLGNVSSFVDWVYIASLAPLTKPIISLLHDTLVVSNDAGYTVYQWFRNEYIIPDATSRSYVPTLPGTYMVIVWNASSCLNTSDRFYWEADSTLLNITGADQRISLKGPAINLGQNVVKAFPNPTPGIVYLRFEKPLLKPVLIAVHDTNGNTVYRKQVQDQTGQIDLSALPKGVYYLEVSGHGRQKAMRIILQ